MTKSSEASDSGGSAVRPSDLTAAAVSSLLAGASMLVSRHSSRRHDPSTPISPATDELQHSATVPAELDVVRFLVPIGDWPAGTTGTVLLAYSEGGVVEVTDTGEEVSVLYRDVEVVWSLRGDPVAVEA